MNGSTLIDMNVITHPSAFLQATFSVLGYFYVKEASKTIKFPHGQLGVENGARGKSFQQSELLCHIDRLL